MKKLFHALVAAIFISVYAVSSNASGLEPLFINAKENKNNPITHGVKAETSTASLGACNSVSEQIKLMACLQELQNSTRAKPTAPPKITAGVNELKNAFAAIGALVKTEFNSNLNFENYRVMRLELSQTVLKFISIHQDIDPEALAYLNKSADAYKNAEVVWQEQLYQNQRIDSGLFINHLPLQSSLLIVWKSAEDDAKKALGIIGNK